MDQFNVNASGDSILFGKNNGAKRHRAKTLIENYEGEINTQLMLDLIETLGLDLENDREEIISLCEEIGIDPKVLGVLSVEEISKSEMSASQLFESKDHDRENEM